MVQHVIVKGPSPEYKRLFDREAHLLRAILGTHLTGIFHIGSTAVPHLYAKPVIDILIAVDTLKAADMRQGIFEKAGYEYLGEFGIEGRRYLRKGGDERTHQVHIFDRADRLNIDRHLAVRDYLIRHPEMRDAYGLLKCDLALRFPLDIAAYCEGKAEFMQELEKRALEEFRGGYSY